MPELPEVEVVRRKLWPQLRGRQIRAVVTTRDSGFFMTRPRLLQHRLPGREVRRIDRIGKYLIATLDDAQRLVLHLGMTGILFAARGEPPDDHTHLRLQFADHGREVWFRDPRRFGRVLLLAPGQNNARLDKLGIDALLAQGDDLWRAARQRRIPIKTLLLDQTVLAGVGNIYADEALFSTGIRPTRRSSRLTRADCAKLVRTVQQIMRRSIRAGGTTVSDYLDPERSAGRYQRALQVYGREGEPCWQCAEPVRRRVLAARSSHFCRKCQR